MGTVPQSVNALKLQSGDSPPQQQSVKAPKHTKSQIRTEKMPAPTGWHFN